MFYPEMGVVRYQFLQFFPEGDILDSAVAVKKDNVIGQPLMRNVANHAPERRNANAAA